jgi:hypothetical protein
MRQTPVFAAVLLIAACASSQTTPYAPVKQVSCSGCDRTTMDRRLPEPLPARGLYVWSLEAPEAGEENDFDVLSVDFDRRVLVAHRALAVKSGGVPWRTVTRREYPLTTSDQAALTDIANRLWAPPAATNAAACPAPSGQVSGEIYLLDGRDIGRMNAIPADCRLRNLVAQLDVRTDAILRREH